MHRWRLGWLVLGILLTACAPTVESQLQTPTTPLTYGWVMVFDGYTQQTWVQVGPKVDASGAHVCVQAWDHGLVFWGCYDQVAPGSTHDYRIERVGGGYAELFDGRVLVVVPLIIQNPVTEVNRGEATTA